MTTFIIEALAARCKTTHNRAISAAVSIAETPAEWHDSDSALIQLSTKLKELGEAASELGDKLGGIELISQNLQNAIRDRLEKCAVAAAIVEQGTSVSTTPQLPIGPDLLSKYDSWASLEASVLQSLAEALNMKTVDGQDKLLSGPEYRALLASADTAFTAVVSSDPGSAGLDDEAPPPYEEDAPEYVSDVKRPESYTEPTAGPSSSKGAPQSVFAGVFRAVTAPFRPKPEPFVAALCEASARGDISTVTSLISSGANINGRNEDGMTPLVLAIQNHQLPVLNKLLQLGASKDVKDSGKKLPPLFWAASTGDLEMAKLLLQQGCKPNQTNMYGHAYFLDIIDKGDLDMVQLLLDHGAKANMTDLYGQPAIHHAYRANNLAMLKLLQSRGGSVNATDMTGCPMVILAVQKNRDEIFNFLIEYGANVNSTTGTGLPLIIEAFNRGRIDVVKKLLERGADARAKDLMGSSMLVNVVKSNKMGVAGRKELVTILLDHGANPNDSDMLGRSAFSYFAEPRNVGLMPLLLEKL